MRTKKWVVYCLRERVIKVPLFLFVCLLNLSTILRFCMRKILGYIKGNFHDFLEIMVDVLNEFLFRHPLSSFLSSRWDLNPDSLGEYATSLYHSPRRRPSSCRMLGSLSCTNLWSSSVWLMNGRRVVSRIRQYSSASIIPSNMHTLVAPFLLIPSHTWTLSECLGLGFSFEWLANLSVACTSVLFQRDWAFIREYDIVECITGIQDLLCVL